MNEPRIQDYIKLATELCWLMNIQDPPVYMKIKLKRKTNFDKQHYAEFTGTGTTNDYLVWPPLFLFKSGQLLSKGIAQPQQCKTGSSKSTRSSNNETVVYDLRPSSSPF